MPRTSGTGRQHGFTLLELMVVMAILVLVAMLFPVALDRALPGRRASSTAEQLASMVREAQGSSLLSGRPVALTVQGHDLVTWDAVTSTPIGRSLSFAPSTEVALVDLEGRAVPALVVYPDGSAQAVRFDVEDGGHRKAVLVSAVNGRVSLASGQ
jgi:type II secretion system protein H